ncbi:MAG: tyrosine-type recombinase/integrase [Bacteroidota bacterium]|jgi:integrase/recombinase XerC
MATFFMSVSIRDAIGFFHDFIKFEKRFSVHTITAYTDDLEHFAQFLSAQFATDQLDQINPSMIRSWMAAFAAQKITPRTINRKISTLKSFFKYCLTREWIGVSPAKTIQVLKTKKRLPTYVEAQQMDQLLQHDHFPDDLGGRMEFLVVNLLYQTGMRVSELVHLKTSQIDFPRSQIKVLGKGNKERVIPISDALVDTIKKFTEEVGQAFPDVSKSLLLVNGKGKHPGARQLYTVVKKYLSLITTADKKSPHVLRHSFATHLTSNGAELNAVKELLGHSSLAATQVYTHNSIERLRDIHKKSHPKG